MGVAHAGAREDEKAADPEGGRGVLLGGRIEFGTLDEGLGKKQEGPCADKADNGRDDQGQANLLGLCPINAFAKRVPL